MLKAKGISPLSVKAGGKIVDGGSAEGSKGLLKGVVAGALVVVAAVAVWLFVSGRGTEKVTGDDVKGGRKPSAVAVRTSKDRKIAEGKAVTRDGKRGNDARSRKSLGNAASARREEGRFVRENVPAPLPLEEMEPPPKPKPAFTTSSEQLLAMVTPSDPSQPVPPLPNLGEDDKADLEKALKNTLQVTTNDTVGSLQLKANVTEQKEEFRKLRDEEGWSFKEYLTALRDKHNEDAQYIADAHRINEENYSDPQMTDEEYMRQRDIINKGLRERGLPELQSAEMPLKSVGNGGEGGQRNAGTGNGDGDGNEVSRNAENGDSDAPKDGNGDQEEEDREKKE